MLRYVCEACDAIHYQNPKIIVGCIPEWDGRILLCRRAIEPQRGRWTLPAGFMENGETTRQAAQRETWEEATARVEVGPLFSLFSLPHINQVYMLYRAALLDLEYAPGTESLEVRLFQEEEVPWEELAFRTIHDTLRFYFADRVSGEFSFHAADIHAP